MHRFDTKGLRSLSLLCSLRGLSETASTLVHLPAGRTKVAATATSGWEVCEKATPIAAGRVIALFAPAASDFGIAATIRTELLTTLTAVI